VDITSTSTSGPQGAVGETRRVVSLERSGEQLAFVEPRFSKQASLVHTHEVRLDEPYII